jgi:hypothetical protein
VARREFTLYWSSLELYETCPQKYLWSRGWATLDVGGGLGRPKPVPVKSSDHHRAMGIALAKVVEDFYNLEMWRDTSGLADRLADRVEKELVIKICRDGAVGFLRTLKYDRLLGAYARAEVTLVGRVDANTPIGGRPDIVLHRDDSGISILDGKNSQSKGKYTDPDQLRWYALCYRLVHNVLPARLGFIYFRYPADPAAGVSGVDWVPFVEADIDGLAARAVTAVSSMKVCAARQDQKASRKPRKQGLFGGDFPSGFVDLGFGTGGSLDDVDG